MTPCSPNPSSTARLIRHAAAPAVVQRRCQAPARKPAAPVRAAARGEEHKVLAQPSFVLQLSLQETSLIIDVFSRDHGRVALVAKGAKRRIRKLRGALQTFQPLSLSWAASGCALTDAEWVGGLLPLEKSALLCGFYLNECWSSCWRARRTRRCSIITWPP
jgi:DNA repair protein RecO (recombination protein O)